MKKIVFILLMAYVGSAMGYEIDPRCNLPSALCDLQLKFDASDKELNDVYKTIIRKIDSNGFASGLVDKKEIKDSLIKSERSWLRFLKANCHAVYVLNSGGTGANAVATECSIRMTEQRIAFLKSTYLEE